LRAGALRRTPQRWAILSYLSRSKTHPTAEQVFEAINRTDPRSSRATVYNNLHTLTRAGLVYELRLEGAAARYDSALHPHHHFVCEGCGVLEDIDWFEIAGIARRPALAGRRVNRYEIVFRGVCAACAAIQ